MGLQAMEFWGAVGVGVGATVVMDLWALVLSRGFGVASLDYCLVGRWLAHMPQGRFSHANIRAASGVAGECALGWLAHYLVGAAFAVMLVTITGASWLAAPSIAPALLFGIATVLLPFLVMQPALGLGIAASKTPQPGAARIKSLATHAVFGTGLYLAALPLAELLAIGP